MPVVITLDAELVAAVQRLTGLSDPGAAVEAALRWYIANHKSWKAENATPTAVIPAKAGTQAT